jgi:hypothetical protein
VAVTEGFSWDQTRYILDYELAPVLGPNLLDIAGEWAGFDDDWLLGAVRQAQAKSKGLTARIQASVAGLLNERLYDALRNLHYYLLTVPPADFAEENQRLNYLARMATDPVWSDGIGFWSRLRSLSATCSIEQVEISFREAIQPIYTPLLVYERDATAGQLEDNWSLFRELLGWIAGQQAEHEVLVSSLEELSYLFTMEGLATLPRGPMVKAALLELGLTVERAEEIWRGPLTRLHGPSPRAEANWRALGYGQQ